LVAGEEEFVKRRIYLTLERGRDIALRNLLRKVFIAGGFEEPKEPNAPRVRRTRIPVAEFGAALSMGAKETMDTDEVECLLANMIYKVRLPPHIFVSRGRHPFCSALPFNQLPPIIDCIIRQRISRDPANGTQNLMKGYIARDRGMVVLSKAGAFPGTGV
jgi:hypothetical protein